jgi:CubicO group peptidase (beta-lactamase class C family)
VQEVFAARRRFVIGAAAVAGGALVGCSDGGGSAAPATPEDDPAETTRPADPPYVPPASGPWEEADAAAAGWDAGLVDELVAFVGGRQSTTFMLLADGRILAEAYYGGATQDSVLDIASCQKSVVSTLVGVVADEGRLRLDDAVTDHIGPGWSQAEPNEEAAITVRHLLTMTSGLDEATLTKVAEPGAQWQYNTVAYQKLRRVLEAATGEGIDELSRRRVFDPIGMSSFSSWAPRPATPFNTDPTGDVLWGLQLTARDMARFGLLAERDGRWGDAVVVPDGWFAEAWTPLEQNPDYGYLWWLYSRRADEGVGVPEDLVAALGALDQRIYVLPSADLVVTRQGVGADGPEDAGAPFDRELLRRLDEARTG